jgi:APA family basic amino acid/polyamine antiporter
MVSYRVLVLRKTQPDRPRPFRTPMAWHGVSRAIVGLHPAIPQPVHLQPQLFFSGGAVIGVVNAL